MAKEFSSIEKFFIIIYALVLFLFLFLKTMQISLPYDEHQFIVSGKLFADKQLIPYIDHPYFHMPYLVFVYAFIFKFTEHLLLSARTFSVFLGWLILMIIFFTALKIFKKHQPIIRLSLAVGSNILLIASQTFAYTNGLTWNHDSSILSALIAFLFLCSGIRKENYSKIFFSGIFLGLAIGFRLSFLPSVAGFLIMLFLGRNKRLKKVVTFLFGILIALLPAIFILLHAEEQFLFGNFGYPKISTLWHIEVNYPLAMNFPEKVLFFLQTMSLPSNLLILVSFLIFFIFPVSQGIKNIKKEYNLEVWFVLLLLPFILMGTFAPTPSYYMYYYALLTFLVIGTIYSLAGTLTRLKDSNFGISVFFIFVIIAFIYGVTYYKEIGIRLSPSQWVPVKVHNLGGEIKTIIGSGKVLTLGPMFPLEGGLDTYEEFTASPYVFRTAHFLPKHQRKELNIISEKDLDDFLNKKPPKAILTGVDNKWDAYLMEYAQKNHYYPVPLHDGYAVWVK